MIIRDERPGDAGKIGQLIREAFVLAEHSSGTEWKIVDDLREAGALNVSLVAADGDDLVGHVALSPVTVGGAKGWYGLGPVAVHPERQGNGIGSALVEKALGRLRLNGASGCVVLGDPAFYGKFGFAHDPALCYADVPPPYFQVQDFGGGRPAGMVEYHSAFDGA